MIGMFSTEFDVAVTCSELEAYSGPCQESMLENFFRTMCNPKYLKPWHIQNPRYIQNTVKHLS